MKIGIQGVEYVIEAPTFGEDLESMDQAFEIEIDKEGKGIKPKIQAKKMYISSIAKCLKSWTFRGYNKETGKLVTEGEVLPITSETIESLPSSHGNILLSRSRDLTTVSGEEVKNL